MRKQLMMFMAVLLLGSYAEAREKLSLSLADAQTYALEFNKTIQNADLAVLKSQEQIRQTLAAGLPQVNATADYSNAMGAKIKIQFDENAPASEIPIKPTSTANLQVTQLIFNANYIVGLKTAKLYEQISAKNKVKTEQDLLGEVINSYYLAMISEASLKIINSNVGNLQSVYDKTAPLVEFGMMEKVELDQLSVQVNNLLNAQRSAERQLELSLNMLRYQLGVSADTELELTDKLEDLLQQQLINDAAVGTFDVNSNVDFQLLQAQGEITAKQVELEKAAYLPSLAGYYSYTYKILKPAFDMQPANMIGLQMNIPIFASGERRAKVRQAEIDRQSFENQKSLVHDQLMLQHKQLVFNLKNALDNYKTQSKNVEVSREVYQTLQQRFDQGMISGLELTSADNNYLKAESDYLQAVMAVLQAQNDLDKLNGNLIVSNRE